MQKIAALTLGTLAGGFARYYFAGFIYRLLGTAFPYGTIAVNLLGCFLIGVFSEVLHEKWLLSAEARLLLMTGFCGAFTTFSTFIFETGLLVNEGLYLRAVINVTASLALGYLVFRLGMSLGCRF